MKVKVGELLAAKEMVLSIEPAIHMINTTRFLRTCTGRIRKFRALKGAWRSLRALPVLKKLRYLRVVNGLERYCLRKNWKGTVLLNQKIKLWLESWMTLPGSFPWRSYLSLTWRLFIFSKVSPVVVRFPSRLTRDTWFRKKPLLREASVRAFLFSENQTGYTYNWRLQWLAKEKEAEKQYIVLNGSGMTSSSLERSRVTVHNTDLNKLK